MRPRVIRRLDKPDQYYKGIRISADTGLHEQITHALRRYLRPGSRVLDFGCGEGALSQRLGDLGASVLSVDIDQENFKASTHFLRLDFNDPPAVRRFIEDNAAAFDITIGIEVIEHVENPWQYLRDLRQLTRHGGVVLISTPNITSWYSRVNFLIKGRFHQFEDHDRAYGHINPIGHDELRYIAESSMLEVLSITPGGWLPRIWLDGGYKQASLNLFGFIASFLMRGPWDGWCLVAVMRRAGDDA